MSDNSPVLSVSGLTKIYRHRGFHLPGRPRPADLVAVNDVSFDLAEGEIIGIAGESGSGKSTTVKCVARLIEADAGEVVLGGVKIDNRTMVEDKVPILGDLPFVGRLFKSTTKQTDTKNVIIFVTVEVVDPSGRRVNRDTAAVAQ
mgnify:CR=1 FL=1